MSADTCLYQLVICIQGTLSEDIVFSLGLLMNAEVLCRLTSRVLEPSVLRILVIDRVKALWS